MSTSKTLTVAQALQEVQRDQLLLPTIQRTFVIAATEGLARVTRPR